jgi:hypothetical protein
MLWNRETIEILETKSQGTPVAITAKNLPTIPAYQPAGTPGSLLPVKPTQTHQPQGGES